MSFQGRYSSLVEQRIRNAKVVGSTPIIGTLKSISYTSLVPSLFFDWDKLGPMGSGSSLFAVRVR